MNISAKNNKLDYDRKINELAERVNAEYDGNGDDRLFLNSEMRIDVYAPAIGQKDYEAMEKRIYDYSIEREKYTVYVWNDSSGFNYWNNDSECNYIQVTAYIKDVNLTEAEISQLDDDLNSAYYEFLEFHTIDEYIKYLNERD